MWRSRLGAEEVSVDRVPGLGAGRVTLRAGIGEVELLEPAGNGIVADELARRGRSHLFGAGETSLDSHALARHARSVGVEHQHENGQDILRFNIEGKPIHFVISSPRIVAPVGEIDFLYVVTLLAADQAAAVKRIVEVFSLDERNFVTITSKLFGYTGVLTLLTLLTLFALDRLDRFEVITPTDFTKTLGRYHAGQGSSFYMAYAESQAIGGIERSTKADGTGLTLDSREEKQVGRDPEQLWLHPPALGGMMLGLSRPTLAWRWSGHPERVVALFP